MQALFQFVKKVRLVLTKGHGPLRAAAPTGWFLAVIYVIMVKNNRFSFVEKNPAKRFFDSLKKSLHERASSFLNRCTGKTLFINFSCFYLEAFFFLKKMVWTPSMARTMARTISRMPRMA